MTAAFGFLNLDKPAGLTSHDVVARIRRGLAIKKVGHTGTLDPLATGVLVICLGGATRLSEYVMHGTKVYRARIHLGISTTTYDAEGEVMAERDASAITLDAIESALESFQGEIEQVPPMYSAIKQGGRKLYDLARAGEVVERQARSVTIDSLRVLSWTSPELIVEVTCSAGTYIRSLAQDLGEALGTGGHLAGLVRLRSGNFTLEEALDLEALLVDDDWQRCLIPPRVALAPMPELKVDSAAAEDLRHGRSVEDAAAVEDQLAQAYGPDGRFLALVRGDGRCWRPHKVFA